MELMGEVVQQWADDLAGARNWEPERDTPRIRAAFLTVRRTALRWPRMGELLAALPAIQLAPSLPERVLTDLQRTENQHRLAKLLASLGSAMGRLR